MHDAHEVGGSTPSTPTPLTWTFPQNGVWDRSGMSGSWPRRGHSWPLPDRSAPDGGPHRVVVARVLPMVTRRIVARSPWPRGHFRPPAHGRLATERDGLRGARRTTIRRASVTQARRDLEATWQTKA